MRTTFFLFGITLAPSLLAADPPRAAPPDFPQETLDAFVEDAFSELVGQRPEAVDRPATTAGKGQTERTAAAGTRWSDWVREETLETEVKRQSQRLAEATDSLARYKASGYLPASDALGLVSLLMAVAAEHDGTPRWQTEAAGLRDLFAEETLDPKPNEASYEEIRSRTEALQELIRGGRPDMPTPQNAIDWSTLASRDGVMRRMETANKERITDWLIDSRSLRRHDDGVQHEAQVLALLAEALTRPGAYEADDADYRAHAEHLRDSATALAAAAEEGDHAMAERAHGAVKQSCIDCHADYRG